MAPAPSIPKAAFWMALSIASFLAMSVAGRATTAELNVFQVLELRSVIGFFILLPLVMMSGGFAAMRTQRPLAHIARNVIHYTGQAAWLYALTLIPLAVLISIEFTTPIWTAHPGGQLPWRKTVAAKTGGDRARPDRRAWSSCAPASARWIRAISSFSAPPSASAFRW